MKGFVVLGILILMSISSSAQCPPASYDFMLSSPSSTNMTLDIGDTAYFAPGADYSGTLTMNGGVLINCSNVDQEFGFVFNVSTTQGHIVNEGQMSITSIASIRYCKVTNNGTMDIENDQTLQTDGQLVNNGNLHVVGYLEQTTNSTVENSGSLIVNGELKIGGTSCTLTNISPGQIDCNNILANRNWYNSGIINVTTEFRLGSSASTGTIDGGCINVQGDFINNGLIHGISCGTITVALYSRSNGDLTGDFAIVDLTLAIGEPLLDENFGTTDPTVTSVSCGCGVLIEDCTNGIDDDLDCNIDCDDESCGGRVSNYINGMSASFVGGQPDFASNTPSTSAGGYNIPTDIVMDPVSRKVFVVDCYNHRVLRYSSKDAFITGEIPEAVIGQADFDTGTFGTAQDKLYYPLGICFGDDGTLWISDFGNNRVVRFDNAGYVSSGALADGVLGQSGYATRSISLTQTGMSSPHSLTMDENGTLWLAEKSNKRVLWFENANSKSNGAPADGVLGSPNFTTSPTIVNAATTGEVTDVEVICNSLYAVDQTNHRVLVWEDASSLISGADADKVLGQPAFTTSIFGTAINRFKTPYYLGGDKYNNLYVSDYHNDRVLVFNEVGSKNTEADADRVIGQDVFTTELTGLAPNRLNGPFGVNVLDDGHSSFLAVADRNNHRVLLYGQGHTSVDENASVSSTLAGYDPSGTGISNFSILSYPEYGDLVLDDPSSGAFTYTGPGVCPFDEGKAVTFTYQFTNAVCTQFGTMIIALNNVADCVENCSNGIDDDLDGFLDSHDPSCDHDGDGVINLFDMDLDNDGILNVDEDDVLSSNCPNIVNRTLFQETFGSGSRTSSLNAQLCFEDGSSVNCSPTYDPATYTASTESGEYTVISSTVAADNGKYGWLDFNDYNGGSQSRMLVCNPSEVGQVFYSFRVDGIVPGVRTYFASKFKNLYPSGSGEPVARIRINFMDTNRVVVHSRPQTLLENETWYNVFENRIFGTESSLIVEFVNENPTSSGNDFVMDDLIVRQTLRDCDGDGVANIYDLDSDNDGITDIAEQGNPDVNHNGMTDNINGSGALSLDVNNNGADDNYEGDPILDTDLDLVWDILDWDSDNDGIYDVLEAGGPDENMDGRIGPTGIAYENGNGLSDIVDPSDGGTGLVNRDSDSDGIMDAKEIDSDNDGCNDVKEAGFPDGDNNGYLGTGTFGAGLTVNNKGLVTP